MSLELSLQKWPYYKIVNKYQGLEHHLINAQHRSSKNIELSRKAANINNEEGVIERCFLQFWQLIFLLPKTF